MLTTSDIQNKADYSASSVGANFGTGFDPAGKLTPQGTSAGIGSDSGTAASTTKAGISGIAGNKDARTTDAQTGIAKIFDASKVQKDIDAQTQITQRFGLEASKAIGDYAATQLQTAKTLRDQAAKESDPTKAQALQSQAQALEKNWGEQGTLRVLAHTAVGGLTGGVSGAAGAATGTLIAPMVAEQLAKAGITGSLAQTLIATASTAAGAAVGGKAGAAAGLNEVANNFLKHDQASALKTDIATCQRKPGGCKDGEVKDIVDKYRALSNQNIVAVQSCVTAGNTQCVQSLESQAASGAEVDAALPFGYGNLASQLATQQNNVKFKGSVNGDSLFGTDLQQAQEVQKFRQDNCTGLSGGACDGLVKQALDDRMTRVGVLMTVGGLTPLAIKGVKALAVPEKAPLTYEARGIAPAAGEVAAVDKVAGKVVTGVGENRGVVAKGTANAATYSGLKLDLKTTQAANEVVESLRSTGRLPPNYVDKTQAAQQGWQPGKALNNSVPVGQLGGDIFNNVPPVSGLPQAASRTWQEVDIGLSNTISRSNQPGTRLLYSNDGLLYITTGHYKTVTPIGTWKK